MRLSRDESKRDEDAEQEPDGEGSQRNERVQANQTWIRACKRPVVAKHD